MSARNECCARAATSAGLLAALFWMGTAAAEPLSILAPGTRPALMFDQYLRDQGPVQDQADVSSDSEQLPPQLRRQVVPYASNEPVGTVIIDTAHTYLYYVMGQGRAMRYGIGVGRDGFRWSGVETISRTAEWPDWIPPAEMISRQPYLPRFVGGGPGNPLGARALYLGNTQYRVHGTNDPSSIGKRVSSGCIRMTNDDVIDLFSRVKIGTKVVVLSDLAHRGLTTATAVKPAVQSRVSSPVERASVSVPATSSASGATGNAFRLY